MPRTSATAAVATLALLLAGPAGAGEAWESLRGPIFGDRAITAEAEGVALRAPYRSADDAAVPIGAEIALPEGQRAARLTLIIDENPMPVSAVFRFDRPRRRVAVEVSMRLNGPSPVRAVVETTDGQLLMRAAMVKTTGQGACAAPPVTDPETALATLGEMAFRPHGGARDRLAALDGTAGTATGRLSIRHPSHSGLQRDQVSLHYIPARFVETVEVWEGRARAFAMTGSISLSENPEIAFTYRPGPVRVRVTDTEGAVFERRFGAGEG